MTIPTNGGGHYRILVVNADDFGLSPGVNEGIIAAHENGIVTSASLMVRWPAARDAACYGRRSSLDLGLHLDLGEWIYRDDQWLAAYEVVKLSDGNAVAEEARRQMHLFFELVGRPPTHIDSHQHVHAQEPVRSLLRALAADLGIPLRQNTPGIRYCGNFYGQSAEGAPLPEYVSVQALTAILRDLQPGITELACHPGYAEDLDTMYRVERALEIETLCHPAVREVLEAERITLSRFSDMAPDVNSGA